MCEICRPSNQSKKQIDKNTESQRIINPAMDIKICATQSYNDIADFETPIGIFTFEEIKYCPVCGEKLIR